MNEVEIRFFDILMQEARVVGKVASTWNRMSPEWRLAFANTITRFLGELGCGIVDDVEDVEEEEQIRILCDRLSDGCRRKLYRHLHALGCRI